MTKPPIPKPDDAEQSKRFEEAARQLEADENGKKFEKAFKAIVPSKQPSPTNKRGK